MASRLSQLIRTTAFSALFLLGMSQLWAQPAPPQPESIGAWKLEQLQLKDGKTYKGVVQAEREHDLDFAEIIQPAGKPMFAVLRWVTKRDLLNLTKLPAKEHEQLLQRFEQFRHRTVIEAGRMEGLLIKA